MRKLFILSILMWPIIYNSGQNLEDTLKIGNLYYSEEKYEDAIRAYEWILDQGWEAPELYFNLGNAYFKSHKITFAILNYERAKLLDPRNEDINHNLNLTRSFVVDKIETVPKFFISQWHYTFVNMFSSDTWALISISSFILLLIFISFYLFSRRYQIKKLSFWISVLLLYVSISSFVFSYNNRKWLLWPETALVISPSVTVESSPDESGTDLFLIHEGTKVFIREHIGEWTRIRLSDGKEGWIPKQAIVEI